MKRVLTVAIPIALVAVLAGLAYAQMGWGPGPGTMGPGPGMMGPGAGWGPPGPDWGQRGPGWGHMGYGHMGPGMMGPGWSGGGPGWYGCPGASWPGRYGSREAVSVDQAKERAQQYADQYLQGFTVDKVLPFAGMGGATMYSVELKGPNDEGRILHVNPWGNVMPIGGPWRRSG